MSRHGGKPGHCHGRRPPLSGAACELAEAAFLARQAADRAGAGAIAAYNQSWPEAAGSLVRARDNVGRAAVALDGATTRLRTEIDAAVANGRSQADYAARALERLREGS
jgi:hypothetical protein